MWRRNDVKRQLRDLLYNQCIYNTCRYSFFIRPMVIDKICQHWWKSRKTMTGIIHHCRKIPTRTSTERWTRGLGFSCRHWTSVIDFFSDIPTPNNFTNDSFSLFVHVWNCQRQMSETHIHTHTKTTTKKKQQINKKKQKKKTTTTKNKNKQTKKQKQTKNKTKHKQNHQSQSMLVQCSFCSN